MTRSPIRAVRQVLDRGRCVPGFRIDRGVSTELLGALKPLGADIECDDARAHRRRKLCRRQADRSLTDDGDGVAAGEIHPP